jgi:hypothetical protein
MLGGSDHVRALNDSINLSVKLMISMGNSSKRSGRLDDLLRSGDAGSSPSGIVCSKTSGPVAKTSVGEPSGLSVKRGVILAGDWVVLALLRPDTFGEVAEGS